MKNTSDVNVSCAICLDSFHAKCIGIKGKDADKIIATPGLYYYCEKHRKISADVLHWKIIKLHKAFKSLLAVFSELQEILDFDSPNIHKMSDGFNNVDKLLRHQLPSETDQQQLMQQFHVQQQQFQQMQDQLNAQFMNLEQKLQKFDPQKAEHLQQEQKLSTKSQHQQSKHKQQKL